MLQPSSSDPRRECSQEGLQIKLAKIPVASSRSMMATPTAWCSFGAAYRALPPEARRRSNPPSHGASAPAPHGAEQPVDGSWRLACGQPIISKESTHMRAVLPGECQVASIMSSLG